MRRMLMFTVVLVGLSGLAWSAMGSAQMAPDPLAFPANYRTWTHTHTNIIDDPKDPFYGYHNVYVNPAGARINLSGGTYPDGSKLVVAFYAVQHNGTMITQGKPLALALMSKDKMKFAATGGWGYALFDDAGMPKTIDQAKDCHGCHESKKASDFVFSGYVK